MDKDSIRQQIIDLTVQKIRTNGSAEISLRKITKELGITTGAFYKHFKNKSELFMMATKKLSKQVYEQIYPDIKDYQKQPHSSLMNLGKDIIYLFNSSNHVMSFLFFNNAALDSYRDARIGAEMPFLSITKSIIAAALKTDDTVLINTTFIQLWSFILGYGMLVSKQVVKIDEKLMNDTLRKLLEEK
ncbi:TetR family transcriptional regulator [Philodulcilactobacillus myokoensis]|uniref:TetR family transcriptional regulator n=1 Tax=Philodulcilactobacillus myokoensis TaxID=2929573 RepID=A0A9W6B385_9LACO|nr:TetR/AcrR family transcriptional regulator [Philodulcilactobacillus myokoensis]GLB47521.1 TetR family transcriptional regulator [Philodulcilactobacillus myokoensis]